jgi:hypothetical protein
MTLLAEIVRPAQDPAGGDDVVGMRDPTDFLRHVPV